jgi:hypothetical protein
LKKTYDNIVFGEHGQSIPLSTDDFIDYLLQALKDLRCERNELKKKLDDIRLILDPNGEPNII